MVYEVSKDSVDYTWVLTEQINRVASLATRYHQLPVASRGSALVALKGAVSVLLDLTLPVVKDRLGGVRTRLERASRYDEVLELFVHIVSALQRSGLLVRKSRLEEEW